MKVAHAKNIENSISFETGLSGHRLSFDLMIKATFERSKPRKYVYGKWFSNNFSNEAFIREIAKIVHGNDYETFESNICDMLAAHAPQESNNRVTTFATISFFSVLLRCCSYSHWALLTDCSFIKSFYRPNLNNPSKTFVDRITRMWKSPKYLK